MSMIETVRSFVNTWECDENDHMNVQFYFDRFDVASNHFVVAAQLDRQSLGRRAVRHVRYHAEMQSGDSMVVHSAMIADCRDLVVHCMTNSETGRLTATALEIYQGGSMGPEDLSDVPQIPAAAEFLPRSQPDGAATAQRTVAELLAGGAVVTNHATVQPMHCDAEGCLLDRFVVAQFSDGAAHAWTAAGLSGQRLDAGNLGRVAVEMKLTTFHRPAAGTPVRLITTIAPGSAKTLSFRHRLFDARTDTLAAIGDVTALVVDLRARRAIPLPAYVVDAVVAMGAGKP